MNFFAGESENNSFFANELLFRVRGPLLTALRLACRAGFQRPFGGRRS